jgi:hypothetical protein
MLPFSFLLSILFHSFALAEGCPKPSEIEAKSCGDNGAFAKAAQSCVTGVMDMAALQQMSLKASVQDDILASGLSQSSNFLSTSNTLGKTSASLLSLKTEAEKARLRTMEYNLAFRLPGGISMKEADKMGLASYFASYPCFSEPASEIAKSQKQLDEKIAEIEKASGAVTALDAKTKLNGNQIQNDSLMPVVAQPARQPIDEAGQAPDIFSGPQENPLSGISGNLDDMKPISR